MELARKASQPLYSYEPVLADFGPISQQPDHFKKTECCLMGKTNEARACSGDDASDDFNKTKVRSMQTTWKDEAMMLFLDFRPD